MIEENEYDFDSSDEEDVQNTVGNVPMEWYEKSLHLGYDISGRPLMKPSSMVGAIDTFINNMENSNKGMVVKDPNTGQNVILSENDILQIKGLCSSRGFQFSNINGDEYVTDWFTRDVMETPLTAHPPQKKSFIPSLLDRKRVSRMVYAIKMGRMKMPEIEDRDKILDSDYEFIINQQHPDVYQSNYNKRILKHVSEENLEWLPDKLHPDYMLKYQSVRQYIRPPPVILPTHEESYNPPEEYLLNEKERQIVVSRFYDRSYNPNRLTNEKPQIPTVYPNLRSVPYSPAPIYDKERRLRDLTHSARVETEKVNSSTTEMLKKYIPEVSKIEPYPNSVEYDTPVGDVILSISISYCGQYIATIGYEFVNIYKTSFGIQCNAPILRRKYSISSFQEDNDELTLRNPSLSWNPYSHLLAVAVGRKVKIINPMLDQSSQDLENRMIEWWKNSTGHNDNDETDEPTNKKSKPTNNWSFIKSEGVGHLQQQLSSLVIDFEETVLHMNWHSCGDYLLTISGKGKATNSGGNAKLHRMSKCASQSPFGNSNKHSWLAACFHCHKNVPLLFLAECKTSNIHVYDIGSKKLVKTLQVTGETSVMEMHPKENHLVVGTFEGKICWFDLDMGITPFKTINVNQNSVRAIALHQNYPLMTCTTANGSVVVFHAMVHNSYDKNPDILPVQLFSKLDKAGDMYSVCFHPTQAKLYSGGAEKSLKEINSCH